MSSVGGGAAPQIAALTLAATRPANYAGHRIFIRHAIHPIIGIMRVIAVKG
jgi:hypothetical protein